MLAGHYQTVLDPDELLTEVRVPRPTTSTRTAFQRFVTSGEDRPIAAVGACLELEADGRCRDVRLAVGAVGAIPVRAVGAEEHLRGQLLSEQAIAETAEHAVRDIEPLDDFRGSADYRRGVARVLVKRTIEACRQEKH
jgi:carbon-monoxide dehydrogenase medium subunit